MLRDFKSVGFKQMFDCLDPGLLNMTAADILAISILQGLILMSVYGFLVFEK